MLSIQAMYNDLLELLLATDGVEQSRRWHPEGDVLYHSLQVFEHARKGTQDACLLAAALLHDVGKSVSSSEHDEIGADLLDGLVAPRVVWLVRHHLDLFRTPTLTKRRLAGTGALHDLQQLRHWDLAGRSPTACVPPLRTALERVLCPEACPFLDPISGELAPFFHGKERQ